MDKNRIFQKAWDDYLYWQSQDKKSLYRINQFLKEIIRNPFLGIGMSEALKGELSAFWNRRIDNSICLVYQIAGEFIEILSCREYYGSHFDFRICRKRQIFRPRSRDKDLAFLFADDVRHGSAPIFVEFGKDVV